jgi:hypothetical protein
MNGQGTTALSPVLGSLEEPRNERSSRIELDRWAATLAASLSQQLPPPKPLGPGPDTTASWRQSVGALTAGSEATLDGARRALDQSGVNGLGESEAAAHPERVHFSTHVAELGEITVMVDRSAGGVRVIIGVDDARAATLIDPERLRLQGALLAAGVGVDSIRVVQRDGRGTQIASPKGNVSRDESHVPDNLSADDERRKRSRSRKVNLVG